MKYLNIDCPYFSDVFIEVAKKFAAQALLVPWVTAYSRMLVMIGLREKSLKVKRLLYVTDAGDAWPTRTHFGF